MLGNSWAAQSRIPLPTLAICTLIPPNRKRSDGGVSVSTPISIKPSALLLRPQLGAGEIPEEGGSTAPQVMFPPTSRVDGIQLSEIIYIIRRHFHTKPQAWPPDSEGKVGQAGKLQSRHWRRVVKPISLLPLYRSHLAGPGHHPSTQFLAIRALDAEHFGLVVTRGCHHNGGIPVGR